MSKKIKLTAFLLVMCMMVAIFDKSQRCHMVFCFECSVKIRKIMKANR